MEHNTIHDEGEITPQINNIALVTEEIIESSNQHQQDIMKEDQNYAPCKRSRPLDEEEDWILVGRDGKRYKLKGNMSPEISSEAKFEMTISSTDELPKQFTFARLMRDNNISNILKIRYINSFKILLQFDSEESQQRLLNCQEIKDKGWRIYKTVDVGTSYGVIRNVEQEMKEEEILESISCGIEILDIKRLSRRSDNGEGWTNSECIRICFKGPYLPPYVNVHGLRVKVSSYTFPVTQCSNCWRFGHSRKMCTKKRAICPKCAKNHENCEAISFNCVNCTGNHIALSKKCPAYLKERKIRDIMAESNCTYRKAFSMYVNEIPTEIYNEAANGNSVDEINTRSGHNIDGQGFVMDTSSPTTYASAVKSLPTNKKKGTTGNMEMPSTSRKKMMTSKERESMRGNKNKNDEANFNWDSLSSDSEREENMEQLNNEDSYNKIPKKKRWEKKDISSMTFEKLMETMKSIFFRNNDPFIKKITAVCKLGCKWLVSFLAGYIYELPFIKSFMGFNG